jgi:hypothetical protein
MIDPMSEVSSMRFKRVLDPVERISETLFGLIMALTFTCTLGDWLPDISIAPGCWSAPLESESCRSQAPYLFVSRLNFLVELHDPRGVLCIVAAQLVEQFANGEFVYFGHRKLRF